MVRPLEDFSWSCVFLKNKLISASVSLYRCVCVQSNSHLPNRALEGVK